MTIVYIKGQKKSKSEKVKFTLKRAFFSCFLIFSLFFFIFLDNNYTLLIKKAAVPMKYNSRMIIIL